jgi:hypothetical protein
MCYNILVTFYNKLVTCYNVLVTCYYKHTAFSWGCYGRWPHSGKNITLGKKNTTLDFVSGDILFPECDIFSLVWSSTITPSTKGSMFFFIILNASSKEDFEFLLESVNQCDTLCTYHYLNKATTTIISTSNIFINNNRKKMSTINI